MDRRAQRCAQWRVFLADVNRLCRLRKETNARPLPDDVHLVGVRPDVETDVGDDAACLAPARLLAAQKV